MLDKEIFGIKNKYWLVVLCVPVIVNVLAWIPDPIAIGDFETWVGFFGNYSGGIVGAFIALLIAKSQTDIAVKQLNHEKDKYTLEREEEKKAKEEQDKVFAEVVLLYLYDEIKMNLDRLNPNFMKALEDRSKNEKLDAIYISAFRESPFLYKTFDDLKYEIPKHNNKIILDSVKAYKAFRVLEKYDEVNKMPSQTAKFLFETITEWKVKLDTESYNY